MHPLPILRPRQPLLVSLLLSITAALALSSATFAAPTLGFLEIWPGISEQGWGGGLDNLGKIL